MTNSPLIKFLHEIYVPAKLDLSPYRINSLVTTINQFDVFAGRPVLSKITDGMIVGFMRECLAQGQTPATVNTKRSRLLAVIRHAWKKHMIPDLPRDVPRCREPLHVPQAWTAEEMQRLVTHASTLPGMVGELPANWYWQTMVLITYETSLRVGAVRALETMDFQPHGPALLIRSETQKTLLGQCLPLSTATANLLTEHLYAPKRTLIFPWPHCLRWFFVRFRRIVDGAGLTANRRGHDLFHKIRRTTISYIARESLELARQQAGHTSTAITTKYYVDPRIAGDQRAVDILPRINLS